MHTGSFVNWTIFPELVQVKLVPKILRIFVAELLQAGCLSRCPTNSIKALKDVSGLKQYVHFVLVCHVWNKKVHTAFNNLKSYGVSLATWDHTMLPAM